MTPAEFRAHAKALRAQGAVCVRVSIGRQLSATKSESCEYVAEFVDAAKKVSEPAIGFAIGQSESEEE